MTLRLTHWWAGAAIAAFDTVVISGLCAVFGVRSECGVCKNRACPTLANCRGDTGCPVVPACRMGECEVIQEVPCAEA